MKRRMNRRQMLLEGGAFVCAVLGRDKRAHAASLARVRETKVISHQSNLYHGWPTVVRCRNGRLLLVYSGGREAHVCPFGRVELICSDDDGETWSWPTVLMDSGIDDRDAGVVETAKGTILVTTFTSLAYESILGRAQQAQPGKNDAWIPEKLQRWQAAHRRLSAKERQKALGVWMVRSSDGGVTWSGRYDCQLNSPHGPVQLSDGRLLYAGKDLWREGNRTGVCESTDDGITWRWLAEIPTRKTDSSENYHELHVVEATDGRLILHIRNHNKANARETLQCESSDGGRSWSVPHAIGVWGLPSHLLRLNDGRILMTYGYRRPPFGNQARLSSNQGRTWSEPMTISADGASGDLGYPSTVQLADDSLVTVWYEKMQGTSRVILRQGRWTIEG